MIKLEEHKQATEHKAVEKIPVSERVWIPLVQHLGKPCLALVKTGDQVLLGQKIASVDAHVSATIHASVSGKVSGISDYPHPVLGRSKAICIENNGRDEPAYKGTFPRTGIDPDDLSPDELRKIIAEAGIVGLGGAGFPTHVKLNPPKSVTELIINAAECEPYLTADFRLMVERTEEIIKGVDLVARCLGVKKVYIAIEDNKPDAAGRLAVLVLGFRSRY